MVELKNLAEADLDTLRHMLGWTDVYKRDPPDGRDYAAVNPGDPLFVRMETMGLVKLAYPAGTHDWMRLDTYVTTDEGKRLARQSFYKRRKNKAARRFHVWLGISDSWPDFTFREFLTSNDYDIVTARRNA